MVKINANCFIVNIEKYSPKEGCKCQVESCSSFCLYGCFGYYLWIVQLFNDACYSYPNA